MKRGFNILILLAACVSLFWGCRPKNGTVKETRTSVKEISIDTANLFFSGIMNHEAGTFYDFGTGETFGFEVSPDKIREVRNRFLRASRDSYSELYCYVRGCIERDTLTGKETLLINNAHSFKRNMGEAKPPVPGKYYSSNTENIYSLTLNERYGYTLFRDEAVISEGTWGKQYDYIGVLMPDEQNSPMTTFTIMYQLRSIYITTVYDGTYIIFQ